MKIFAHKDNKVTKGVYPIIIKVCVGINKFLKLYADWLQKKTSGWSTIRKKVVLFFFCAAFVLECIFVVYQSFQTKSSISYIVTPIRATYLLKNQAPPIYNIEKEFRHIHDFRLSLDSLRTKNKTRFDSLLLARPHLLDTMNYLEKLYYEQQSNRK